MANKSKLGQQQFTEAYRRNIGLFSHKQNKPSAPLKTIDVITSPEALLALKNAGVKALPTVMFIYCLASLIAETQNENANIPLLALNTLNFTVNQCIKALENPSGEVTVHNKAGIEVPDKLLAEISQFCNLYDSFSTYVAPSL